MTGDLRKFNLDFCRGFSSERLRLIYKDEDSGLIDKLIEAVHGKSEEPAPGAVAVQNVPKKRGKK